MLKIKSEEFEVFSLFESLSIFIQYGCDVFYLLIEVDLKMVYG